MSNWSKQHTMTVHYFGTFETEQSELYGLLTKNINDKTLQPNQASIFCQVLIQFDLLKIMK